MDTNETGARLDLSEGLHIGGTGAFIWAPPYDGEAFPLEMLAQIVPLDKFAGVSTSNTLTQEQLNKAQQITIFGPQEEGDFVLNVNGFVSPGKLVVLQFSGPLTGDFSVTVRFLKYTFEPPSTAPEPGPGPVFTADGQFATMQGSLISPPTKLNMPSTFPVGAGAYSDGTPPPHFAQ
jgi:hypothetical protein